jgi:hypothetical protein
LLDAIGKTIHKIGNAQKHSKEEYRAADYLADSDGTRLNYKVMAEAVTSFREYGGDEAAFASIRADVKRRGGRK